MNKKKSPVSIAVKEVISKLTSTNGFMPLAKSLLTLPIFFGANYPTEENKSFTIDYSAEQDCFKFFGYENITILSKYMSLDFDFEFWMFLIRKFIKSDTYEMSFTYEELFSKENMNVDRRNFPTYKAKVGPALEKFRFFTFSFTRTGFKTKGQMGLVTDFFPFEDDTGFDLVVGQGLSMLYLADKKIITNLDMKKFKAIKSEFGRVLYLLYISNNANAVNRFTSEVLHFRIQSQQVNKAEVNRSIKNAHLQLINLGLLTSVVPVTAGKGSRVVYYDITLADNRTKKGKAAVAAKELEKDKAAVAEKESENVPTKPKFSIFG